MKASGAGHRAGLIWGLLFGCLCLSHAPVAPADVSYALGPETELLDAAFYAGQAEDGSDVAGRMAYMGGTSHDGRTVGFFAINRASMNLAIFLVDFGDPSSWRRLTVDFPLQGVAPIRWSLDDSQVVVHDLRISVTTGQYTNDRPFGFQPRYQSMTQLPDNNWMASNRRLNRIGNIAMCPVLSNGEPDFTRGYVMVTDFGTDVAHAGDWPSISPDGDTITFQDYGQSSTPGVADVSDIYVLRNVRQILAAPKKPGTDISSLAPTNLSDPNITAIRTYESVNVACAPDLSSDASLVFYSEDVNNQFLYGDFLNSLTLTDFDIMISRTDGSGEDTRLAEPGNQVFMLPTPGGTRLVYARDVGAVLHLFATTLVVASGVSGTPVGDPGDNDIITVGAQEISDASNTTLEVAPDTMIDFPPGFPQEITVTTPLEPVAPVELPPDVDAIPAVREFGPPGTLFDKPVVVTITYTDAEVARMNESELRIFRYNAGTGLFDIEITTIVARDPVNNAISFTVDHFSRYGLGAEFDTDTDGLPDAVDTDDDNDGIPDVEDAMPIDTDNDGLDNPQDLDDDGDTLPDVDEVSVYHTNPLSADTDDDDLPDAIEILFGRDPLTPEPDGAQLPLQPASVIAALLGASLLSVRKRKGHTAD